MRLWKVIHSHFVQKIAGLFTKLIIKEAEIQPKLKQELRSYYLAYSI